MSNLLKILIYFFPEPFLRSMSDVKLIINNNTINTNTNINNNNDNKNNNNNNNKLMEV